MYRVLRILNPLTNVLYETSNDTYLHPFPLTEHSLGGR